MNIATAAGAANVIGKCPRGHRFIATAGTFGVYSPCPTCGPETIAEEGALPFVRHYAIKWGKPTKVRVTQTKCDAACRSAKSGYCSCSCGGANHGANLDRLC
jgi:hypothetical protein